MTVVIVGDNNADMVIRLPSHPFQKKRKGALDGVVPQVYGGGSAANTAVALARLGVPVSFVGAVGDDGYGRLATAELIREGVDVSGQRIIADAFTPVVIALIEPDGERILIVWPPERGADLLLKLDDLDTDMIAGADWLHTTGICLRASPIRETALEAMRLAKEWGVPVSLDLNLRLELWGWRDDIRAAIDKAIALADVVFGNAQEEIVPLARVEAVEAAAHILADGKRTVIARHGIQGALAATAAGTFHAPAFRADAVDTVGAGDAFDGGFIAARLAGHPVPEALRWGSAVAALQIQHPGARSGLPRREAVIDLLERHTPKT